MFAISGIVPVVMAAAPFAIVTSLKDQLQQARAVLNVYRIELINHGQNLTETNPAWSPMGFFAKTNMPRG